VGAAAESSWLRKVLWIKNDLLESLVVCLSFCFSFCFVLRQDLTVAQAGLKLTILLP
jgi:hypothetical protein